MNHDDHPGRTGSAHRRRRWAGLAAGLAWCAGTTVGSALLVPSDPAGGYYLIDHGRAEHFDTRWGAVGSVAVITALLVVLAGGLLAVRALPAGNGPKTGLLLAASLLLLLGGLIQVSVPLVAAQPGSGWTAWVVLAGAAVFVIAVFAVVARAACRSRP